MSRSGSRRVIFSPDVHATPTVLLRSCTAGRHAGEYERRTLPPSRISITRRLCSSAGKLPAVLFRYVGVNVVRALRFVSSSRRSPSSKVSPRTFSKRFVPPQEPHHREAMEDCIKFINSSSRRASQLGRADPESYVPRE